MDLPLRSRSLAASLIAFLLLTATVATPPATQIRRPKNVQVSLRAKWPGTPLLLEAGELISKEWPDLFWEFTDLWLDPDRGSDCSSAKCCLQRIVDDGRSLLTGEHLGSVFELSLTLRSASPRLVLYRQLAEESLSSYPIDDEASMAHGSVGGSCCWVDNGSTLLFDVSELSYWLEALAKKSVDFSEQPELFDFDHVYSASNVNSPVVILYGALGTECFDEFHVRLVEASKKMADEELFPSIPQVWRKKVEVNGNGSGGLESKVSMK